MCSDLSLRWQFYHEPASVKGGLSSQKRRLPERINVLSRPLRPCVSLQEFPRERLPAQEQLTSPIKQNTPRRNVCFFFLRLSRTAPESSVRLRKTQRRGSSSLLQHPVVAHVHTQRTPGVKDEPGASQQDRGVSGMEVSLSRSDVNQWERVIGNPWQLFLTLSVFSLPRASRPVWTRALAYPAT